ncbi:hypothetical protein AB0K43_17020 [Kitasatospora sp. NPDC049258]|uniref:hypothetical protein n=1 Tax=Kitasatospora sp. NPDC049258 TaxID=3155394 RepID=UPI003421134F
MDDGRHGIRHEIDFGASVIAGQAHTQMVCECGVVTGDAAGHHAHVRQALHVPGPAWFPVGARLAIMLVGGVALLFGLMAVADTFLSGTARTAVLGLSLVVSFAAMMGAAHGLRPSSFRWPRATGSATPASWASLAGVVRSAQRVLGCTAAAPGRTRRSGR